jgi:hypothetical protein
MAPVRYTLLSALALAADGSPITKWARRLSGPSDACKQACPNLEAFIASMDPADSQDGQDGGEQYTTTAAGEQYTTTDEDRRLSSGEGSIDMDGFGTQALEAMQSMCQYKDVIPCLQENSDVCDIPDNFTETSDHLTCICDLCPGIIEAQVGFMTVFVNVSHRGSATTRPAHRRIRMIWKRQCACSPRACSAPRSIQPNAPSWTCKGA